MGASASADIRANKNNQRLNKPALGNWRGFSFTCAGHGGHQLDAAENLYLPLLIYCVHCVQLYLEINSREYTVGIWVYILRKLVILHCSPIEFTTVGSRNSCADCGHLAARL